MAKKTPKDPQRAALIAASEQLLTALVDQPKTTKRVSEAAAVLQHVIDRGSGRPNRSAGKAEQIYALESGGKSVREIVEATGLSERTVRRHLAANTKPPPAT